ncbi:BTAD domain-containing putative transcriptional regulator [Actinoplanes sp. CA-054009]
MLALTHGGRLRRERVTDALWPDLDPPAAGANLRKALHSARRNIAVISAGDLLCLPEGAEIDVNDYWSLSAAARRDRDPEAYEAAIGIYRDGLLPEDLYEEWASGPRDELRTDWLALLAEHASLLEAAGDLNGALRSVRRRVTAEPLAEEDHAWLMRLYALAGRRDEAGRQYETLRALLDEELGIEPSPRTQRLYEEIRAAQAHEPSLDAGLWERVGDLRMQSGDGAGAVKAYEMSKNPAKVAAAWLLQHRPDEAERALGGIGDPGLRASIALERGDLDEAQRHAREAHDAATDPDDVTAALETLALVSHMRGDWRPDLQDQIKRLAANIRVARFCDFNHCLSQYQLYGDDFAADVGDYARETLALAERVSAVPAQAFAWCLLGESFLLRAEWDEAAACLDRSCELYEPLGSRTVALPWLRRAELAASVGDRRAAEQSLKRATAIAAVTPMARHAWARLHATAAFAAAERGEPELVIREVRASRAKAARFGACPTCSALLNPVGAQAYAMVGDLESARGLAEAAEQFAGSFTSAAWLAMADSAAAHATADRARHEKAADGYDRAGHLFWGARERRGNAASLTSFSPDGPTERGEGNNEPDHR